MNPYNDCTPESDDEDYRTDAEILAEEREKKQLRQDQMNERHDRDEQDMY